MQYSVGNARPETNHEKTTVRPKVKNVLFKREEEEKTCFKWHVECHKRQKKKKSLWKSFRLKTRETGQLDAMPNPRVDAAPEGKPGQRVHWQLSAEETGSGLVLGSPGSLTGPGSAAKYLRTTEQDGLQPTLKREEEEANVKANGAKY